MADNNTAISDALTCPLCKKNNACANIASADEGQACWCTSSTISFPKGLLEKLPEAERGQACICQTCVLAYQNQKY
jgi:hypothetical protein